MRGLLVLVLVSLLASCGEGKREESGEEVPALVKEKGCLACHGVRGRKVGPSFMEIAERYGGREGAVEEIKRSVLKGSLGRWGSVPMYPQPVSEDEAEKLARWILSVR